MAVGRGPSLPAYRFPQVEPLETTPSGLNALQDPAAEKKQVVNDPEIARHQGRPCLCLAEKQKEQAEIPSGSKPPGTSRRRPASRRGPPTGAGSGAAGPDIDVHPRPDDHHDSRVEVMEFRNMRISITPAGGPLKYTDLNEHVSRACVADSVGT